MRTGRNVVAYIGECERLLDRTGSVEVAELLVSLCAYSLYLDWLLKNSKTISKLADDYVQMVRNL